LQIISSISSLLQFLDQVGIRALVFGRLDCLQVLFLMLTRLKLTRGEGQIVEPSSHLTRRKHIHSPQVSGRHSPSMAHAEGHERVPTKDEDLRKAVMEMREMMKILMERNILS
jgi:hypothetical protein